MSEDAKRTWVGGGLLVLTIVIGILYWRDPGKGRGSAAGQKLDDSLTTTKPVFDSTQATIKQSATTNLDSSRVAVERARHLEARASRLRYLADSLKAEALVRDSSAKAWKAASDAYERTADSLAAALAEQKAATAAAQQSALRWHAAYLNDSTRSDAIARLNLSLKKDIEGMEPKCTIGPMPCPNRTVTGIAGLVIGVVASHR